MTRIQQTLESPGRFRGFAIAVLGIALLVRFAVLLALWHSWGWHDKVIPDDWNKLAINMVDHGTFGFSAGQPTIARGPVFPLLEVPLYLAFGEMYSGWASGLLFLDAFTCLLAIILFRKVWGNLPALLAGLFCALNLPVVYYTAKISQFTSILPLVVIYIYLLASWERDYQSQWRPWILGLVSGLMILNKTVYLPVPFLCSGLLLWSKWRELKCVPQLLPVAVYLLFTLAVVAPWTARNYVVTGGRLVPVQNMFWELFVQDVLYYDLMKQEGLDHPEGRTLDYFLQRERQMLIANHVSPEPPQSFNRPKWEYDRERAFRSVSLDWVKQDPVKVLRVKVANFWNFWLRAENWQKTRLMILMQIFYLGAAMMGIGLLLWKKQLQRVKYGLIIILVLWAEHCLVFAWGRFSLDLVPILGLVFGTGIAAWAGVGSNSSANIALSNRGLPLSTGCPY